MAASLAGVSRVSATAAARLAAAPVWAGARAGVAPSLPSVAALMPGCGISARGFAAPAKKAAAGGSKKRKKAWTIKKRSGHAYSVDAALHLVQSMATARFDETVELALQLGVDPRKPGQAIRGVVQLPHGTGKAVRVAVFARGEKADAATEAGADVVGAEDLVEAIQSGQLAFDKAIATPDMMALVGRVARVLGPRGLMPNPKLGTVTADVAAAVSAAKAGQAEYRVERNGIIHAGVGKASFSRGALRDNLRAFMLAISAAKPDSLKGHYLRHATLSSTQGRGVNVAMASLDPSKAGFMEPVEDVVAEVVAAAGGAALPAAR